MFLLVTGKIAAGKTEIMKILSKNGFQCVFADDITHKIYNKGQEGQKAIMKYFGEEFVRNDGDVNRIKLRNLVFNKREKLLLLNRVVHPIIFRRLSKIKWKKKSAIESVYFDAELLGKVDFKTVYVQRPKREIIKTLIKDRGFSKKLALKAFGLIKKPQKVDFLINNSSDLKTLNLLVCKALGL